MASSKFFDETSELSAVKTAIVSKYFWAWAKVIIPSAKKTKSKIAYIDLFSGPGKYKDGTFSTPLIVLEKAISDTDLRNMLLTIFNDKNQNNSISLEKSIMDLPGIDSLKYKPKVTSYEVGDQIANLFQQMHFVPALFFVDPWGYKGLSLNLVGSILKDWGCDCIFFFNYNRINMGLNNQLVRIHMDSLFGQTRALHLKKVIEPMKPLQRELTIVEELCNALKEIGGEFVLPFCFKNEKGNRTSHHLIFISKHIKGYEIMKEIMAKESSESCQGVPTFEYNPAEKQQPLLFELSKPLEALESQLLNEFSGQTLSMKEIYTQHNVGRQYIARNYKEILKEMERQGRISTNPPASSRRENTFSENVMVSFPPKKI